VALASNTTKTCGAWTRIRVMMLAASAVPLCRHIDTRRASTTDSDEGLIFSSVYYLHA
jgi:hypothetical protein